MKSYMFFFFVILIFMYQSRLGLRVCYYVLVSKFFFSLTPDLKISLLQRYGLLTDILRLFSSNFTFALVKLLLEETDG